MKRKLCDVAGGQSWIVEAPVTVVVVGDITAKMSRMPPPGEVISVDHHAARTILVKTVRDASIAADHMVMAATDEGLGTCWIAKYGQGEIRAVLGVPENCYVVALITIGHAAEEPNAKPRHGLKEIVFQEKYGLR